MATNVGEKSTQKQAEHLSVKVFKPEIMNNLPLQTAQSLIEDPVKLASLRRNFIGFLEQEFELNPDRDEQVTPRKKPAPTLGIGSAEQQIARMADIFPRINLSGIEKHILSKGCLFANDSCKPVLIPTPSFLYRHFEIDRSRPDYYEVLIRHMLTCLPKVVDYSDETKEALKTIRLVEPEKEKIWDPLAPSRDVCPLYVSLTAQLGGWSPRAARLECKGQVMALGLAQLLPILMLCDITANTLGTTSIADYVYLGDETPWSLAICCFRGAAGKADLVVGRRENQASEFYANAVAFN